MSGRWFEFVDQAGPECLDVIQITVARRRVVNLEVAALTDDINLKNEPNR
jgi:hypothetical protein